MTAAAMPAGAAAIRLERVDAGLPESGQWRNGFAIADLDGDGRLDLAHGPPRRKPGPPVVFRGDGTGRFSPWREVGFPDLPFDYGDAVAADFDGDGRADLALAVHLGGLTVLSAAAGGFIEAADGLELLPPGKAGFSSRSIEAVDWDGDGRLDLVALGEGPAPGLVAGRRGLAVFRNLGGGRWQRLDGPEDPAFGDSLALGDLDGDGRLDAVVASRRLDDRDLLRRQRADGSWEIGRLSAARASSYFPAVTVLAVEAGRVSSLALSWVEQVGDGWRSGIDVLHAAEGGWEREVVASTDEALEIPALAAGDLDGDGVDELVAGDASGAVRIYRPNRRGVFRELSARALRRAGGGCAARALRLADLDGDGAAELIVAFAGEPDAGRCQQGGSLQVWRARRSAPR